MAYGRLDVFWPDGKFETFLLADANISVGRSSGNSITLDTDTISRYHFSLTRDGNQVFISDLDSANGTFVDGTRLTDNERFTLRGGEEVQIGHLRMNFHVLDDMPTLPIDSLAEDTQRIEKEAVEFRIELQLPHIAVAPGSYTSVELTVHNTSQEVQQYVVAVGGLPEGWARVNRPIVEIDPEESTLVLINIKPLRRSDSKPGIYYALVGVHPREHPDSLLEAEMKVTILPFSGFGMALSPKRISTGEKARLHLHNQGSAPLPIYITGSSPNNVLDVLPVPSQLVLGPGQRTQAEIEAKPRRSRLFGKAQEHTFDVQVHSQDDAHFLVPSRGRLIDKPPLPTWALPVIGASVIGALLLVIVGLSGLFRSAPPPQILSFVVNNGSDQIARGEPLQVAWTVRDVEEIRLELDGEVLDQRAIETPDIVDSTGQYPIDNPFGQNYTLTLIAEGSSGQEARQDRIIRLFDRVAITSFTADPPQIVRYVRQTLTLNWEVVGDATISGLEPFLNGASAVETEGSLQAIGVAEDNLNLILTVRGEFDQMTQQALGVPAVPPECTSLPGEFTLHEGPNEDAAVVTSITSLTTLIVDGRDGSGGWLRFPVTENVLAWGPRDAFKCNENFVVDDLRVVAGEIASSTNAGGIAPPLTPVSVTPNPPTPSTAENTAESTISSTATPGN